MSGGGFNIGQALPVALAIAATVATDGATAELIPEAMGAGEGLAGAAEALPVVLGDSITSTALPEIATGVAPETWASGAEAVNSAVIPNAPVVNPNVAQINPNPYLSPSGGGYGGNAFGELGGGDMSHLTTEAGAGNNAVNVERGLTNPYSAPANTVTNNAVVNPTANAAPTTPAATSGTDAAKKVAEESWWKGLSGPAKMGVVAAGTAGLGALLKADSSRYGMPSNEPYSGALSKFSYNPNTYTPAATPAANIYKPRYMAAGGISVAPKVNDMQAIDDYIASAAEPGGIKQLQAKAEGGDYNAMVAMNKIHGTPNKNYAMGGGIGTAYGGPDDGGNKDDGSGLAPFNRGPQYPMQGVQQNFAAGGHLGSYSDGGRMLKGPGDGMSDSIPASIAGKQPARLADSEFVVPADVVSHLGNGSSDAGAKKLYSMMDNVRKARTGTKKQGKQIKAEKFLPA